MGNEDAGHVEQRCSAVEQEQDRGIRSEALEPEVSATAVRNDAHIPSVTIRLLVQSPLMGATPA